MQTGLIAPDVDADSAQWWQGIQEGQLMLPFCLDRQEFFFPPASACPLCGATQIDLRSASGRGRVFSWITVHQAADQAFVQDTPYTVLLVELDEGPRLLARATEELEPALGLPVVVVFYRVQRQVLFGFALDRGRGNA